MVYCVLCQVPQFRIYMKHMVHIHKSSPATHEGSNEQNNKLPQSVEPPEINYFLLVRKGIKLLGSWGFVMDEFTQAIEMIRSGKVDRKPIITHEFPLDRAKEAFETQLNYEEAIKVLLKP